MRENKGVSKEHLQAQTMRDFDLTCDKPVFYCDKFALRFSSSMTKSFSNCVLSLSNLKKYDDRPFIVCVVMPTENYLLLANSSFLKKISHSSQELRCNNIRGTFLGSDIMREIDGIKNEPENFKDLFLSHEQFGFSGNLERLVEATSGIVGTRPRIEFNDDEIGKILEAPQRAKAFMNSDRFEELKNDLTSRVDKVKNEICIAAFIENINIRGRIIEYLITSESSDRTRQDLIEALNNDKNLPNFVTADKLGDYSKTFAEYVTETDIKTKVLFLDANPKAYNIDKLLEFLSKDNSVYLIFFVGIDERKQIKMRLCSMFEKELLQNTRCMRHWAGRNTRGVTQFYGAVIKQLLNQDSVNIDENYSTERLKGMIEL